MSKLSKEFKSGFIFLLAIVFLVYGLKYLKGLNVFQSNKPYYAIYDEIDGLQVGSAVRLNGFNVGMVNNIVLNENNNLFVDNALNLTAIYVFVLSFVFSIIFIHFLISWVRRSSLLIFVLYRIIFGTFLIFVSFEL